MKDKKENVEQKTRGLGKVQEDVLEALYRYWEGITIIGLTRQFWKPLVYQFWKPKTKFKSVYNSVYRAVKTLENKYGYVETKVYTKNEHPLYRKPPGQPWSTHYGYVLKGFKPPTRVVMVQLTETGINYLTHPKNEEGWFQITD